MLGQLAQYYTNVGSTSRVYWSVFATHMDCATPLRLGASWRAGSGRASWRRDVMTSWHGNYHITVLWCPTPSHSSGVLHQRCDLHLGPAPPDIRPSGRPSVRLPPAFLWIWTACIATRLRGQLPDPVDPGLLRPLGVISSFTNVFWRSFSFFRFIRLFWNQTFTCRSLRCSLQLISQRFWRVM